MVEHRNPVTAITQIAQVPHRRRSRSSASRTCSVLVEGLDYDYTAKRRRVFDELAQRRYLGGQSRLRQQAHLPALDSARHDRDACPTARRRRSTRRSPTAASAEAKSVIAQWLGIPGFDRYVILRIDATKEFIAAIGGVNVDVKIVGLPSSTRPDARRRALDYDDTWGHLHIHLKEGMQHLNGEQAVAYMRFRHDWCSDPCRIMRQQQVLHALADKLKGDRVNTLLHLGDLLAVFRKYVQTDFTDRNCSRSPRTIREYSDAAIVSSQVPYTGDIDLPGTATRSFPTSRPGAHLVATMLAPQPTPLAVARRAGVRGDPAVDAARRRGERQRRHWGGAAARGSARARPDSRSATVGNAERTDYSATRDPRALERYVRRCARTRGLTAVLARRGGGARCVDEPSPVATATPAQRRYGDRRQRLCKEIVA